MGVGGSPFYTGVECGRGKLSAVPASQRIDGHFRINVGKQQASCLTDHLTPVNSPHLRHSEERPLAKGETCLLQSTPVKCSYCHYLTETVMSQ